MNDYIKKEDALEALDRNTRSKNDIRYIIKHLPSADVVEVVRCRECMWFEDYESILGTEHYCKKMWCSPYDWSSEPCFYVEPNDFCSYGERAE